MVEHHLAKVGVAGSNPVVRLRSRGCLLYTSSGPKERPKGVSDGQQVDIPVLEYIVMEGRSRLTKPDDWKCLAKQ